MDTNIKVTIVTATYNLIKSGRVETFKQCLESVHSQSHKNIEHWVVDGSSTDGTLDLIKEYADKGWISYVSEKDTGIYNAMNKGIERASGKYISFLNSDDFYCNDKTVQLSVEFLEKEQAEFSFGKAYLLNDKKNKSKTSKPHIYRFWTRMSLCHQTIFCKTEKMKALGGFDETFKIAGDFNLMLKMLACFSKFVEVPAVLATFRLGGFSAIDMEKTNKEAQEAIYAVMKDIIPVTKADVEKIYQIKWIPFDWLRILVNGYPCRVRYCFYLSNILTLLKRMRQDLITVRLGEGKRHIRFFFIDILKEKKK